MNSSKSQTLIIALLLLAGFASGQQGPQLLTVFPPGAKAGETVEVTFAGSGFDGDEKLLFSAKGFTAEPAGKGTVDPKAPKGAPVPAAKRSLWCASTNMNFCATSNA